MLQWNALLVYVMAADRRDNTVEIKVDTVTSVVAGMRESAEAAQSFSGRGEELAWELDTGKLLGGAESRVWELPGLVERSGYLAGGGDSQRPFLLFTAAGDKAELLKEPTTWLHPDRNFDLAVLYYGDSKDTAEKLRSMADYFLLPKADAQPASKFQHLKRLWDRGPVDFMEYKAIGVWDDDAIVLRDSKIDTLFAQFLSKPSLFVIEPSHMRWLEPSFKLREGDPERTLNSCRTSYEELKTTTSLGAGLRYVDFLEVNFPIFRADKLSELLNTYTTELPGWGIDILMTCVLLRGGTADVVRDGFAVAGGVPVCNPLRPEREIAKVSDPSGGHGKALWAKFKEKHVPECHFVPWEKGITAFGEASLD